MNAKVIMKRVKELAELSGDYVSVEQNVGFHVTTEAKGGDVEYNLWIAVEGKFYKLETYIGLMESLTKKAIEYLNKEKKVIPKNKIKKSLRIFEAHPNAVIKGEIESIFPEGFSYIFSGGESCHSWEDLENMFLTKGEAIEARKGVPEKLYQEYLTNDTWIEELYDSWVFKMPDAFYHPMLRAIETKTGIKIKLLDT